MKVRTNTEKVLRARKAMLEFLLLNHPLDCPVCDQAGECDLQNYYMEHGRYESRFLENKAKRKKAYPIGRHVILDQERCILCSRCVRFCEEITKSHELGIFRRGERSAVDLCPGATLDNPYSGNLVDVCPVGALTEREFRFQCRVWYLSSQESVCTGCSRGCNVYIHYNTSRPHHSGGRRVLRLKPRFNSQVNQWWMCDEGRFGFEFINRNRIERPHARRSGRASPTTWNEAEREFAAALRASLDRFGPDSIGVVASPQLSNEELLLVRKLFVETLGVTRVGSENPWERPGFEDNFLIRADKNPNTRGAVALGLACDVRSLLKSAAAGEIKVLYVLRHDFSSAEAQDLLGQAPYVVYQGPNWNCTARLAHLVLASTTHAEDDGTFTNFEGRVQLFRRALTPWADSKTDFEILARVAAGQGAPFDYSGPEDVFAAWRGRRYDELGEFGLL
jgi:NADH-quinone oxidoreductase subunit G